MMFNYPSNLSISFDGGKEIKPRFPQ